MPEFYYKVPSTSTGREDDSAVQFAKKYNDPNEKTVISFGDGVAIVRIVAQEAPKISEDIKSHEIVADLGNVKDSRISWFTKDTMATCIASKASVAMEDKI